MSLNNSVLGLEKKIAELAQKVPGRVSLENKGMTLRRVTAGSDPATETMHRFLLSNFGRNQTDSLDTIQEDASDRDVFYHIVERNKKVLSLANTYLLPLGTEVERKSLFFVGYVATRKNNRRQGLMSAAYRKGLMSFAVRTKREDLRPTFGTGEMVTGPLGPTVEKRFNDLGYRRLYFRNAQGIFQQIHYYQPPLHINEATGQAKSKPVLENLMLWVINDPNTESVYVQDVVDVVQSLYYKCYLWSLDDFEGNTAAGWQHRKEMDSLFRTFRARLPGPNIPVFLFTASERNALKQEGKIFIEVE